jgi:MATE family multidrug resistance protein
VTVTSPTTAKPGTRALLALAVPALGTLAAEPLLGLFDTALIGHLGAEPLAGLGAAIAVLNAILALMVFLEYGTTARLARSMGRGDMAYVAGEASQLAWLATGLGVLLTALIALFARPLLTTVDVPADAAPHAVTYLTIRAAGVLPGMWVRVGNGIYRGLQDTKTPLYFVIAMNAVNGVLDPMLIYGFEPFGVPAFGVAGAAWASVAATWIGAALFASRLLPRLRPHVPDALRRPHLDSLIPLFAISRDIMIRTVSLMAALFMGSRMAAGLGTSPLAAHQIGWQLWGFAALVLDSVAIAGQAVVGRLIGAGDIPAAREVGDRLVRWATGLGVVFAVGFGLFRHPLVSIFTDDAAVRAVAVSITPILALAQIPNGALFAYDGLLIGASDFRFLRNSMIVIGLAGVAFTWIGRSVFGTLGGVWLGIAAYMVLRLLVMAVRWRSGRWATR